MQLSDPRYIYLTEEEAAKICKVSPRHLKRLHDRRQGPPRTQLGRSVRYNLAKLLEHLESQTSQ